jgi:hypothetical protein
MKKIALLLILFLYLVPAIGITVSAHYCGSRITWLSLNFEHQEHKCACGSKKMKTDCCKDEITFIKLDNKQINTSTDFNTVAPITAILNPLQGFANKGLCLSTQPIIQLLCLPPPDNLKHPLYVRHCTFLI